MIKDKTKKSLQAVWSNHLSVLIKTRADNLSPLEFQYLILNKLVEVKKYNTAISATRLLVTMFDFAVAITVIKENPLKTVYDLPLLKQINKLAKKSVVHRASFNHLTLNTDLKKLVSTFKNKAGDLRINLLRLSLSFLLRPSEMVKLNINNLDRKKKIITVKDTKTLDNFIIPISDQLIELIDLIYEKYGNKKEGYIFKGFRYASHLSAQTLNRALKDLGYKNVLCAHGIRSIGSNFFSHHAKDVPPYVREAILQHSVSKIEKAYRRDDFYLRQRVKAMELWYAYLDELFK